MSPSENLTQPTDASVEAFLQGVEHPVRRADARVLDGMFRRATGREPVLWGPTMVGYGQYHYVYESGRSGDALAVGFSPRRSSLSLYGLTLQPEAPALLERLGKHRRGAGCLYVNTLADVDLEVLEELIRTGYRYVTQDVDQGAVKAEEHFTAHAATWDQEPGKVDESRRMAAVIAAAVPLGGEERLLEYGAGTGLVSQGLVPHVGAVTLADSSEGMRRVAGEKVATGVLPAGTRVWDLDLETGSAPEERFDLVVASLVLHHVHDVPRVLSGFHALLDPGGHVAITDLDTEDGTFHARLHDFDGHPGFDRGHLVRWLQEAGFEDVAVQDCLAIDKDGTDFPVFLATARRP